MERGTKNFKKLLTNKGEKKIAERSGQNLL